MRKSTLIFLLIIIGHQALWAQQDSVANIKQFRHYVHFGYNFGGAAPVPLPNNIRKIESYSPGFSPSVGYEVSYSFNKNWSVNGALRYDIKAMTIIDSVQYLHTFITMDTSSFEGDFTGTNKTDCKNAYLTLPITAVYSAHDNWRFKVGIYMAYLVHSSFSGVVSNGYIRKGNSLGEKVDIDTATFNFDNEQRKFDWGFVGGVEKKFLKSFAVTGELQWGMKSLFPSSFEGMPFKLTNIFFTLGVKKQLFE